MLKECLVSQLYINYITKNYFINGLLFQEHILKFHDFIVTFSAPESQLITFQILQDFSRLFGTFLGP